MKFNTSIIIILLFLLLTPACQFYVVQNIIGNPTADLDKLDKKNKFLSIKTSQYNANDAFLKTRSYLYSNQADVYSQKSNKILYVRNLTKIFPFAINTTTIKFEFLEENKYTIIKLTSRNIELSEYFKDTLIESLQDIDKKIEKNVVKSSG